LGFIIDVIEDYAVINLVVIKILDVIKHLGNVDFVIIDVINYINFRMVNYLNYNYFSDPYNLIYFIHFNFINVDFII